MTINIEMAFRKVPVVTKEGAMKQWKISQYKYVPFVTTVHRYNYLKICKGLDYGKEYE